MRIPRSHLFAWFTSIGLLIASPLTHAITPPASGTYTGSITIIESSCAGASTDTVSLSLTLSGLNGTSFIQFADGDLVRIDIVFTITTATEFDFTWTATGINNTYAAVNKSTNNGTFTSNTITLNGAGLETNPSNCTISFTGTLTLSIGVTVDPAVTASSSITEAALFNTQIQGAISGISGRIGGAMSGAGRRNSGPRFTNNSFKMDGATGLNAGDGSTIPTAFGAVIPIQITKMISVAPPLMAATIPFLAG